MSVTEETFDQRVIQRSAERPVIVDFWADWCAPCLILAPLLDEVMKEYASRVELLKVEVDDNMRLAGRYQLRGFPTVIFYHQGEELDRFAGAKSLPQLREFLDTNLARLSN